MLFEIVFYIVDKEGNGDQGNSKASGQGDFEPTPKKNNLYYARVLFQLRQKYAQP